MTISTNNYLSILTDDLAIKEFSTIPLKSNSQYLSIDLAIVLNKNKNQVYGVDSKNNGHIFFQKLFTKNLRTHQYVIYLASSQDISNAYDDALLARSTLVSKDRIFVINTKMISAGVLIPQNYLIKLLSEGLTIQEAVPKLEKYLSNIIGLINLRNTKNIWFKKSIIELNEHITMKSKLGIRSNNQRIISEIMKYEETNHISNIYITYTSKYLQEEAQNIKLYLEKKLRYFGSVEVFEDIKTLSGFGNVQGIGMYIG
jgi:Uncharacterised protein, DegV family COG1307